MNRSSKLGRVDVHCLLVDWCTLEIDKDYDLCQSMQVYGRVYDNSRTVYSYSPLDCGSISYCILGLNQKYSRALVERMSKV